ncbi:probable Transcription initiation factor IIE subunit beta [Zygosaccharomyces bailii]|nr:probable Transcription initiation factor IIE subunit beta [Zygosaccharomyces bailii]
MSSNNDHLLANLNAFKSKVKSAPVLPSKMGSAGISGKTSLNNSPKKRAASQRDLSKKKVDAKIKEDNIEEIDDDSEEGSPNKKVRPGSIAAVALQASQSDISKSHDSSKLLWATEYIQKKGKPVQLNELMDYLSIKKDDKILELLKKLDKIQYDPKKMTFKYMSTYDVHSAQELLNLLRSQVTFKGISCKELKDGWPQCDETINELEEDSKILVLRTKKDRTPRYVWYNNGGELNRISEDFVTMWENVQLPQFAELPRKLQDLGLKPASVDPATVKRQTTRVEVKKKRQRRGKVTNTHMAGVLKDYSQGV